MNLHQLYRLQPPSQPRDRTDGRGSLGSDPRPYTCKLERVVSTGELQAHCFRRGLSSMTEPRIPAASIEGSGIETRFTPSMNDVLSAVRRPPAANLKVYVPADAVKSRLRAVKGSSVVVAKVPSTVESSKIEYG